MSSWLVRFPLLAMAIAAIPVSIVREGTQSTGLLANAAAVAVLVHLFALTSRGRSARPFSLVGVFVILALLRTGALLAVSLFDGKPGYVTADGPYSYNEGAWLVAAVRSLFLFAMVQTALLVRPRGAPTMNWRGIADRFGDRFLGRAALLGFALMIIRLVLLFTPEQAGSALAYASRVLLGYFLPVLFFGGIALRRQQFAGIALAIVSLAVFAIALLAGSRGDAMLPLLILGVGYAAGKATATKTLSLWLAVAFPLLLLAGFLGQQLRGDEKGRTGQAALERTGNISMALASAEHGDVIDSTFLRMVSTSEHAIITRIPAEMPFEEQGLLRIPLDFVSGFLPRFELDPKSADIRKRNWILNDFGITVNSETSTELTTLADGWLRGGFLGVILAGILVGLVLQRFEDWLYRRIPRDAVWFVPLVFAGAGVIGLESLGIAAGFRAEIFNWAAGFVVAILSPRLSATPRAHRVNLTT